MEVGGRKILMNESLFVPNGESATVVCQIAESETMPVRFEFPQEPHIETGGDSKSPEARFMVEYVNPPDSIHIDCLVLKFFNFNMPLGQTLTAPVIVANADDGQSVTFFAAVHKLGSMTKIEFQFMLGAA